MLALCWPCVGLVLALCWPCVGLVLILPGALSSAFQWLTARLQQVISLEFYVYNNPGDEFCAFSITTVFACTVTGRWTRLTCGKSCDITQEIPFYYPWQLLPIKYIADSGTVKCHCPAPLRPGSPRHCRVGTRCTSHCFRQIFSWEIRPFTEVSQSSACGRQPCMDTGGSRMKVERITLFA